MHVCHGTHLQGSMGRGVTSLPDRKDQGMPLEMLRLDALVSRLASWLLNDHDPLHLTISEESLSSLHSSPDLDIFVLDDARSIH